MATQNNPEPTVLPSRPYLKPWYHFAQEDHRMILHYGHEAVVLEGKAVEKLFPVLLPLLDGTRTLDEINEYVGERAQPAVQGALQMLQERELLTDGPPASVDTPKPAAETAQLLASVSDKRSVAETQELLGSASTSILGNGPLAREIGRVLGASGVGRLSILDWPHSGGELEPVDLVVVAPEPDELPEVEDWNRLALETRVPWLQVLPFDGGIAAVGPLYLPGETCCYECYLRRRGANLDLGDDNFWALGKTPAAYPAAPALQGIAVGIAATLALQWLCDPSSEEGISPLPAIMHAIEWGSPVTVTHHRVYRVPRCRQCFGDDLGTPSPWHS